MTMDCLKHAIHLLDYESKAFADKEENFSRLTRIREEVISAFGDDLEGLDLESFGEIQGMFFLRIMIDHTALPPDVAWKKFQVFMKFWRDFRIPDESIIPHLEPVLWTSRYHRHEQIDQEPMLWTSRACAQVRRKR